MVVPDGGGGEREMSKCNVVECPQEARVGILCSKDDPYDTNEVCADHVNEYEHVAEWLLPGEGGRA